MGSLRLLLGTKRNALKGLKREKRKQVLQDIINATCDVDRYPEEVAIVQDEQGDSNYQDYQVAKARYAAELSGRGLGDTMGESGVQNREKARGVCSTVMNELKTSIIDAALAKKPQRLGGFNWERWACMKTLHVCNKTWIHKGLGAV